LNLPVDFENQNFIALDNIFKEIKNEPYSLILMEKIIEQIENITLNEEYRSISVSIDKEIIENKININLI
jgi:outer membrane protein insertion porin family